MNPRGKPLLDEGFPKGRLHSALCCGLPLCTCLPGSWDLPCALSQICRMCLMLPSLYSFRSFPSCKARGWGTPAPMPLHSAGLVGKQRTHGIVRILNRDFLESHPSTTHTSGVSTLRCPGWRTDRDCPPPSQVALKEGREGLWVSGEKARGRKMAAALHRASRESLSRGLPTCSAVSCRAGAHLGMLSRYRGHYPGAGCQDFFHICGLFYSLREAVWLIHMHTHVTPSRPP